jgi:hypothetical protein
MGDHPASDPAKPGSKLASMQALGRKGGVRSAEDGAAKAASKARAGGGPAANAGAPDPLVAVRLTDTDTRGTDTPVKRPSSVETKIVAAGKATVKAFKGKGGVAKAKAALKRAEKAVKAKLKKPGPPAVIGKPWVEAGVSKAKYYRDLKAKAKE